nr:YggT family protein [Sphingomonas jejuensis]
MFVLLDVLWWVIIIQAVLSWLVAFNVINTYNDFVRSALIALDRITAPIYRPIRRIMPDLGALDLSPLVVLLALMILRTIILPNLYASLVS